MPQAGAISMQRCGIWTVKPVCGLFSHRHWFLSTLSVHVYFWNLDYSSLEGAWIDSKTGVVAKPSLLVWLTLYHSDTWHDVGCRVYAEVLLQIRTFFFGACRKECRWSHFYFAKKANNGGATVLPLSSPFWPLHPHLAPSFISIYVAIII